MKAHEKGNKKFQPIENQVDHIEKIFHKKHQNSDYLNHIHKITIDSIRKKIKTVRPETQLKNINNTLKRVN